MNQSGKPVWFTKIKKTIYNSKKIKNYEQLTTQKKGRVHTHPFAKKLLRVEGSKIKHVITNNHTLLQNYEIFSVSQ